MLDRRVRILNFDQSVLKQKKLLPRYNPQIIEFTDIGPKARYWFDKKTEVEIAGRLKNSNPNAVTLLGSGDFHHISSTLIAQCPGPFSVIIFDFHPDWDTASLMVNCGSWVTRILKSSSIRKCVLVGVSSEDISSYHIQTGNTRSLQNDRVEIYPYAHRPTTVFFKKIPFNASVKIKPGFGYTRMYWEELKNKDLKVFMSGLIKRLPEKRVYLSMDKDCLSHKYAVTNWEEGFLSLKELLDMITVIKENTDIIGADIVGDYSPPKTGRFI